MLTSGNLRRYARILSVTAMAAVASTADAITVRVGSPSDPACLAFTVPGAIARLPADGSTHRILLSNNQSYPSGGVVDSRNVSIEGGYASCSAPESVSGATTRIGPSTDGTPLLTVRTSGTTVYTTTLRRLDVAGPAAGGGVLAQGNVHVVIVDSSIREAGASTLPAGGGVRSALGASIFLRGRTEVLGNRANSGAGLSCDAGGRIHIESSDVLISGNVATAVGGGVALTQKCQLLWDPDTASTQGGINGNRAVLGGGIYADDGDIETSEYAPLPRGPRRVIANIAEYSGGGISLNASSRMILPGIEVSSNTAGFVNGPANQGNCGGLSVTRSLVRLSEYRIEGNVARGYGGGGCLRNHTIFAFRTAPSCTDGACRSVSSNRAGSSGGAFWLDNNAALVLKGTRVTHNVARLGAAIHAEHSSASAPRSTIDFENALFVRNTATIGQLFGLANTSFNLLATTIADNATGASTINDLGGNTLAIRLSIVTAAVGTSVLTAPFGTTLSTRCVISNENASLSANGGNATVTAPGFVDAAAGNYRLRADGNAVDACANIDLDLPYFDVSGNARPIDLPIVNLGGSWDIGAYETQIFDQLFADGFD